MPTKAELRTQLLTQRRQLSTTDWQNRSDRLCQQLQASPLFTRAQTVLTFSSYRHEPDLSALYAEPGKTWGFPRCVGEDLVWHAGNGVASLQPGAFGILEPSRAAAVLAPEEVDLILVPCVACDRHGTRLGYGGGFYDRMLGQPQWRGKTTVGITFALGYLDDLPKDPWDVAVQWICTEAGWFFAA